MAKQKVVIVGGGFGGTKAALDLAKTDHFDITLVSDHADFRYYPSLYRTATGGRRYISSVALSEIFKDKPVEVEVGSVEGLDRKAKTVNLQDKRKLSYDTLILALGVKTNYFGIKGLDEFSYGIKNVDEAERFKNHLHKQVIDEKHLDLNYVIIGGGPTGVELAGELPGYLRQIAKNHGLKHNIVAGEIEGSQPSPRQAEPG